MTSPNQPPPLPSGGGDPSDASQLQKAEEIGRLQSTFQYRSFDDHPSAWDSLWNEAYTPWDRGGPSLALKDLLTQHPELFPPKEGDDRPKALVPGCGRGHDVLLLSSLGFGAYGLDFSERAIQEAKVNEKEFLATASEEGGADQKEGGAVTWIAGDFFDASLLQTQTDVEKFDLVFDYTVRFFSLPLSLSLVYIFNSNKTNLSVPIIRSDKKERKKEISREADRLICDLPTFIQFFCALPPSARPKWAARVSSLLDPQTGRLICLEWPLHKPPKTGGPPWGVTSQVYLAHLSHPGEPLPYDDEGNLIINDDLAKDLEHGVSAGGSGTSLERIARVRPTRTHKAGYDPDGNMVDFISVWKVRSP